MQAGSKKQRKNGASCRGRAVFFVFIFTKLTKQQGRAFAV
jgi:hypothetical protein